MSHIGNEQAVCDRCNILGMMQRYIEMVETDAFEMLNEIFVQDAVLTVNGARYEGLEQIADLLRSMPKPRLHLFNMGTVSESGDGTARVIYSGMVLRQGGEIGVMRVEDRVAWGGGEAIITSRDIIAT